MKAKIDVKSVADLVENLTSAPTKFLYGKGVTLGAILDLLKQRSVRIQTGSALLRCERKEWFCVTTCPLKFFSELKIRPVPCERPRAALLNDDTYS